MLTDTLYQELNPQLRHQLMVQLVKPWNKQYSAFFLDSNGKKRISSLIMIKFLQNLRVEFYPKNSLVYHYKDRVDYISYVRRGSIHVLDKKHRLLRMVSEGAIFGIYQIMLDLRAGNFYRLANTA